MKTHYQRAWLCFFLLIFASLTSYAQDIKQEQIETVRSELERFSKEWQEPEPFNSRFGIIQLVSLLDLDYPGLEKVRDAARNKDWESTQQQLWEYFKYHRKYPKPGVEKLTDTEIEASENALIHYFRGNKDAHPLIFRGASIDWQGPAFNDGKEIKDREWQFIILING